MPALLIPSLDALRLALASGLIPGSAAQAPGRAGFDGNGHLWLEPDDQPSRELLTALGRLGVVAVGSPGVATQPVRSWAELLPLRRTKSEEEGLYLFEVPDREAAALVARIRRGGGGPVGVRLLPEPHAGRAWVTAMTPSRAVLLRAAERDSPARVFQRQTPTVWTTVGWEHPLASHLAVPPDGILMFIPEVGASFVPGPVPEPHDEDQSLSPHPLRVTISPPPPRIDVRFRLSRAEHSRDEIVWVLRRANLEIFRRFCASADQRLLSRFLAAVIRVSGEEGVIVRRATADDRTAVLPVVGAGYCPDSRVPELFLPCGLALRPLLRTHELARALGVGGNRLIWLEPADHGVAVNTVSQASFRPLDEQVEYTAPLPAQLVSRRLPDEPFPFARVAIRIENAPDQEPSEEADEEPTRSDSRISTSDRDQPGWVSKVGARLMGWVRVRRGPSEGHPGEARPPVRKEGSGDSAIDRVDRKLTSADALVHGHDRAARRHELESRLLEEFSHLGADERAARWVELASVYGATGQPLDAAVCWTNAIWECPVPPEPWLEQWAVAEVRAAKRTDRGADLERWLSEPGRPGTGRVLAALTAYFGAQAVPSPAFITALPRVLAVMDQQFDDVPVRSGWLARLGAARASGGDALGLARWHDRLIRRLSERGPGLDLDEPSFLRFRGTTSAERFKTAREWLTRVRDPILAWVKGHASSEPLEWAGLSAETTATVEYAQLMLAWGLGVLGERARSRDWSARARKALSGAAGARADPAGHAFLGDLFLHRIKEAHEGHVPKAALPTELQARYERLPEFARYSADRLRDNSRILQPIPQGCAFRGLDLKEFWGTDRLGERLSVLAARLDPSELHDEARALLARAVESPSTATLPRITFGLLRVAASLTPPVVAEILEQVPTALDWIEVWIRAGRWKEPERIERTSRFQSRMIEAALAVAEPAQAVRLLAAITRGAAAGPLLHAATASAPIVFRSAHRCGLTAEAEALVRILDPARGNIAGSALTAQRVGLAIGWFAAGDEEAGFQLLNAARAELFSTAASSIHNRTALAVAYAEALGFAPGVIALGRLEEMFQRFKRVSVQCSSNCYYTLHPLRLIDTVVRAVVTDEFTLGPAVRSWLDEDEFLIRQRIHHDMRASLQESEPR